MKLRSVSGPARLAALVVAGLAAIAACSAGPPTPTVPRLAGTSASTAVTQAEALHLAGQCIRQHGIPGFADPTLTAPGQVSFGKTQLAAAPKAVQAQALTACRTALSRAGIQAGRRHGLGGRPSPAQLRQIVAFARCMRAHGLPDFPDPDPATGDITLPAGLPKTSPVLQRANQACRSDLPGSG